MDFQLSEEQRIFKKTVHDFADQRLAPLVKTWEEGGTFIDRKMFSQYAELGLLGIPLPEKYGGGGLSTFEAILAIEELARVSPIAAARLLIYRAAINAGLGVPSVFESSVAKCFSNEMAKEVTDMAMQVSRGHFHRQISP
jgi:alkylation response protein AidB-like acyl-CoA dehydrogenase